MAPMPPGQDGGRHHFLDFMPVQPIRFATFLAPLLSPVYRSVARYVGLQLGCKTEFLVGTSYRQVPAADVYFICGLAYVELVRRRRAALEPLVAPILYGSRDLLRPVYFSNVIVHRNSPFQSFADLRGRSWCYNEPLSQSGYGVTCYHLACLGEERDYFGKVVRAGYHQRSVRLVASGRMDAATVDAHVLAIMMRRNPGLASQVRAIASLGPSTIQPIVASPRLPKELRQEIRMILTGMHQDPTAKRRLSSGLIDRFVHIEDEDYDDIRRMQAITEKTIKRFQSCRA
jgi:phosphonate transport system substrate-binding protein